ncbi:MULTISPECIES: mechanosensitive ion channel family protein [Pseudomonas]|jgi:small-conductance mechanosensitive channel|uniref:mechanosensitive ion channel family protein n=1 Tax=Pseudomonas TaxID=286 RepID=UPI0007613DDD|nr:MULTISPECIES: mechanosensitive ion channel family protein [Pseudomonas]MCE1056776.1 mechanosensitive ion channel family protein [Pseudomonas alloputida]MDH1693052.1 mechanosensitive ion channel family protein [Pseudomonas sp. GD03766]MDN5518262.1 mechanosensitive ion channel family protein [Pseudomonas sp.]MDN5530337.1 mechanosensitive ion channel family protein [Pseudomonas sp.]OUS82092.1 mechanosensitive ion channel protein MscS [Pseudomonas putida]
MGNKRRFGRAAGLMLLIHLLFSPLLHADTPQPGPEIEGVIAEPAPLTVINRTVLVFRATLLGETPTVRAQRAKKVIEDTLQETNDLEVRVDPILHSYLVLLGGRRAFIVTPLDAAADTITTGEAAEQAAENLRLVVEETRQARSLRFLLTAVGYSAAATLVFFMLVKAAGYCRRKLLGLLPKLMGKHSERLKVGHTQLFDLQNLYYLIDRSLWLLYWLLVLLFCYQWLGFVLSQFPYTRSWGESLNIHLMALLNYLISGILRAMPGLAVALSIFFIARGISAFSKRVLRRMARPGTLKWLTAETLQPTMRLTSLAIWLFALVMAYPYLPGSGTDAFKGLSVLLGLMVSLGATSVIGQGAAGLILTYTRTLRVGEFVRVGDYEGTVTEVGMFTTTIRTGLGEVLTLPNSMITGSVTKNYSRIVQGPGYVVDTVVTIGYDTPWRQVEAMLLEAARRTDGVLQTPMPQVFQTALSDFYPEYRLVAQAIPSEPRPRAQLLSLLHANIQDVFNEYGVQIMSPHYLGDPEQPKWVPKEQWHTAPSKPENTA